MKRTIVFFALMCVLVFFAACGGENSEGGTSGNGGDVTVDIGSGVITADEAKGIAFTEAGVSEADVSRLEVELDREHGGTVYEVEFKVERVEYSYLIDAYTGEILKKEKEMN